MAWKDYGEIVVCDSEAAMIAYSDYVAAEHLQVHTADARDDGQKLRNYGSLFIGELASVVYSDKCIGTNHTLPTVGAGRYTGGLWVGAYVKIATHQWLDERGVKAVAPPAARQSASETLEGIAAPRSCGSIACRRKAATRLALSAWGDRHCLLDLVGLEPRGAQLLDREARRPRRLEDRLLPCASRCRWPRASSRYAAAGITTPPWRSAWIRSPGLTAMPNTVTGTSSSVTCTKACAGPTEPAITW